MTARSDSDIPLRPAPSPLIPRLFPVPENDSVNPRPRKLGPSGPGIRPVPEIPWLPPINPPTPFPTPGILPPGPAPSAPPTMPDDHYYKPPLSPERLDQIPQSENLYPPGQPAPAAQNLTAHVLRMKGVPEAGIAAAINDPALMKGLLNQLYGRRSMIASGAGGGFGSKIGADTSDDQAGRAATPAAATPDSYLPFGWAGLPALQR
jgi:hypothetical protein